MTIEEMKKSLKEALSTIERDMRETSSIAALNIQNALKALQEPFNVLDHYSAIVKLRSQMNDAERDMFRMHGRWQVLGETLKFLEQGDDNGDTKASAEEN